MSYGDEAFLQDRIKQQADRIEALKAALREIETKHLYTHQYRDIARAALAPEQDK